MSKVFQGAASNNHKVMNVYLNDYEFNPREWYTDGVNSDNIRYDEDININKIHDET